MDNAVEYQELFESAYLLKQAVEDGEMTKEQLKTLILAPTHLLDVALENDLSIEEAIEVIENYEKGEENV